MTLMHDSEKKNNARTSHNDSEASKLPTREELQKRYKDSQFLTSGQIFGQGDGRLGTEVRDEVIRRNETRKEKEAAVVSRKKTKLQELISRAKTIKAEMKNKDFKLTVDKLRVLVSYKKRNEDAAIPSGKAALLARWNETKHRLSPRSSPNNSDDEEEEEE